MASLGLYLHIPFCESICNYCNFNRVLLDPALKARYVDALAIEIRKTGDRSPVDTIYFGGGTPSLLTKHELVLLLDACRESFDVFPDTETTLEVNPETVTSSGALSWIEAGVTRISLGVQSFRDTELKQLSRIHSAARAREALKLVREAGGKNVNLDLMLWLPKQTPDECRESIEILIDLEPDHASFYMLELYPNAPLREEMVRGGLSLASDEDAATMYLEALELTDAAGYEQYEISNISRPSKKCRHNLKYWHDGDWLGFGCGAHSHREGQRWRNVAEISRYIHLVDRSQPVEVERRTLTPEEQVGDALFMGLRLSEGLDLSCITKRYGVDVMQEYGPALAPFLEHGMLAHSAGRLQLTRPGMLVANEVMRTFV